MQAAGREVRLLRGGCVRRVGSLRAVGHGEASSEAQVRQENELVRGVRSKSNKTWGVHAVGRAVGGNRAQWVVPWGTAFACCRMQNAHGKSVQEGMGCAFSGAWGMYATGHGGVSVECRMRMPWGRRCVCNRARGGCDGREVCA